MKSLLDQTIALSEQMYQRAEQAEKDLRAFKEAILGSTRKPLFKEHH
jgi:hypothetical protein